MELTSTEQRITKHFVMVRIFVILVAVPFFKLLFDRFDFVDTSSLGFAAKLVSNFEVFDSVQLRHVATHGYLNELNHAFFPMFPFLVDKLSALGSHLIVGFWL